MGLSCYDRVSIVGHCVDDDGVGGGGVHVVVVVGGEKEEERFNSRLKYKYIYRERESHSKRKEKDYIIKGKVKKKYNKKVNMLFVLSQQTFTRQMERVKHDQSKDELNTVSILV